MEQMNRTEGLRALIRQGLQAVAHKDTLALLGDRSSYIGMRDIGQHWECPRAALARKVKPTTNSLERLLTLQRGHWFESGVGQALASLGLHVYPSLRSTGSIRACPSKPILILCWSGVHLLMPYGFWKLKAPTSCPTYRTIPICCNCTGKSAFW